MVEREMDWRMEMGWGKGMMSWAGGRWVGEEEWLGIERDCKGRRIVG